MNQAPPSKSLEELFRITERIGADCGVPPEAVALLTLAHVAALAGGFITHQPTGQPVTPAKFSLLVRTPDFEAPPWISNEWQNIARHQSCIRYGKPGILSAPADIASLRRRKRVLTSLGSHLESFEIQVIDANIDFEKRRKTYSNFYLIGSGKRPPLPKNGSTYSLAANGYTSLRQILRSRGNPAGFAAMIDAPAVQRANLIGWVALLDWKRLTTDAGPDFLPKLGWIIEATASSLCHDQPLLLASSRILQKLDALRFADIHTRYEPEDRARALLDRQVEEGRAMVAQLPPAQREAALPSPSLAWHLAALVSLLCAGDKETEVSARSMQAARLGVVLASWAIRQHLHHYRHAFPADDAGPFLGQDLSVVRFLKPTPLPVRAFMRHLRGVNKAACLLSLRRAVAAGLALEPDSERFAAVPAPGVSLSEKMAESAPPQAIPAGPASNFTDGTDKTSPGHEA
jgi:hypothetical protein